MILILASGAFALIAWLVVHFSIYALPFAVGLGAASLAHQSGAGLVGAGVIGLVVGGVVHGLGRFACQAARSTLARAIVAALFVLPAGVAGYYSALGFVRLCVPGEAWQQLLACGGAFTIAGIAYERLTAFAPLRSERAGGSA